MNYYQSNLNLLIIEDNEGDLIIIEEHLLKENSKIKTQSAITYSEAKNKLLHTKYDAILLDLSLPDANGEALVKGTIELSKNTPVIVLTGYTNKDFGINSLNMGVSDYLVKDELNCTQLYKTITYSIERKKITKSLEESERKYRNLFHHSPIPMWVYEISTLKILSVNNAATKMYGYSEEEFLNMTIKDIRPLEEIPILEDSLRYIIENNVSVFRAIHKHKKKNNDIISVDIQASNITFNNVASRLVIATDVTERLEYIEKIEEQNKKLRDIAWMQSHVVRAPLARILGLTDLLVKQIVADDDKSAAILLIENSAKELDKVIREIIAKTEKVDIKNGSH